MTAASSSEQTSSGSASKNRSKNWLWNETDKRKILNQRKAKRKPHLSFNQIGNSFLRQSTFLYSPFCGNMSNKKMITEGGVTWHWNIWCPKFSTSGDSGCHMWVVSANVWNSESKISYAMTLNVFCAALWVFNMPAEFSELPQQIGLEFIDTEYNVCKIHWQMRFGGPEKDKIHRTCNNTSAMFPTTRTWFLGEFCEATLGLGTKQPQLVWLKINPCTILLQLHSYTKEVALPS